MRYGVCASVSEAARLCKLGFDYVEVNATSIAEMTEEQYMAFCAENTAAPIHAETANCLFPGSIRLTGEDADMEIVRTYAEKVMERLGKAGVKIVVFGSGGSRRVPEGFCPDCAWKQLIEVGRILGNAAEKNGVTVALEPLRAAETNIIIQQTKGLKLVQEVNHPRFKLLCDYFHLMQENGTMADVEACAGQLVHLHMAEPVKRVAMSPADDADYSAFFASLKKIGYNARVSFEGSAEDWEAQLPGALQVMQNR